MGFREEFSETFSAITALVSIGLYFFDLGTDIWLAVEYFKNGDNVWGGLTTACICFPIAAFLILVVYMTCVDKKNCEKCCLVVLAIFFSPFLLLTTVCGVFLQMCRVLTGNEDDKFYRLATMTQVLEALCESFPQFLLQIYILLADESVRSFADIETSKYVSMAASVIMLSWSFTCYEKMMYYMANQEKMPICGQICLCLLKFFECLLRLLTCGLLVDLSIRRSVEPGLIILIILGILFGRIALLAVADLVRDLRSESNYTDFKRVARLLYAAIQRAVCYTTIIKIPNTTFRIAYFYGVVLVETIIVVALWLYLEPDRPDWVARSLKVWIATVVILLIFLAAAICINLEYNKYKGDDIDQNLDKNYCRFMACPCSNS